MAKFVYADFISKVKEFEGFRPKPYKCPSGVLTIGYGHTHGVVDGMHIDEFHAMSFLYYDINLCYYQLTATCRFFYMYNLGLKYALVDFVFNVGIGKFLRSTLYNKYIKNEAVPNIHLVSIELYKWVHSGKKVLKGLEKRRSWEVSLLELV